jgi:hypothetical protein
MKVDWKNPDLSKELAFSPHPDPLSEYRAREK